jgi:outer membrane protein
LVVDYVFNPQSNIRPYVGAGINFTTFFSTKSTAALDGALGATDIKLDDSWGAAAQAGVDVDLNKDWFFNASVWYMDIKTKATLNSISNNVTTTRTVDVTINPWALSVGIGTHF